MLSDDELHERCTCGHTRSYHGMRDGSGTCLILDAHGSPGCACDGFYLDAAAPAFTPEPLGAVPTAAEIDLEDALAWNADTIRLLQLAAKGRREYAKGMIGSDMARALEGEAEAYDAAAKIAAGVDRTKIMRGLLPSHMWGEIDE